MNTEITVTRRCSVDSHTIAIAMTVTARGHSDDTFGIYWDGGGVDHDDSAAGSVRWARAEFPDGSGFVFSGQHGGRGPQRAGWTIGVAPLTEDYPTRVPITCAQQGHTMELSFEAPAGTRLVVWSGEEVTRG